MKQLNTRWSEQVKNHPERVLQEYPRPQMKRDSCINLNGYWKYAITKSKKKPQAYDGKILVPFSPEAELSGVNHVLMPEEYLWYCRMLPEEDWKKDGSRWLLHFGAVDQVAVVYVNGRQAGKHKGGYLPFTVDVTDFLREKKNELLIAVRDVTDTSYYSRGKQKLNRGGMFYTAQSGIWQTVWMEPVPKHYIERLRITPNYDEKLVEVEVMDGGTVPEQSGETVEYTIDLENGGELTTTGQRGQKVRMSIPDMRSWSPEDPYLYSMKVKLGADVVSTYFAMRKIELKQDANGIPRPYLNNRPYFQRGVLDQGYWPDGLYTAPCDEAMIFDIMKMKQLGFNMLRKHIKIEPDRWYYHCDRLGMLVWQDMVCGGGDIRSWYVTYLATLLSHFEIHPADRTRWLLSRREEEGRRQFEAEMKETIQTLYNHPSLVTWVIFNEGWGQFDAKDMIREARKEDQSRLFDQASGWFDQGDGEYHSIHNYFFQLKIRPKERIEALTEYGGYSWHMDGHSMCSEIYGYRTYENGEELSEGYRQLHETEIIPNIAQGLSVTVYTQLSDVEEEVNGIYTYDREVLKIDEDVIRSCNEKMKLGC